MNPIKGIINSLSKLLSKLNCKWKCSCFDCDCQVTPEEIENVMRDAIFMFMKNKYPNLSDYEVMQIMQYPVTEL
jgi:hypothetical protein